MLVYQNKQFHKEYFQLFRILNLKKYKKNPEQSHKHYKNVIIRFLIQTLNYKNNAEFHRWTDSSRKTTVSWTTTDT